jgi:hypothetical protein
MIQDTVEYKLISNHYGAQVAKRSQVPLINHINEGLIILDAISATERSKRAFCLHPLFQADADLKENWYMARYVEPHVLLLTMEYRNIANAYLSDKMDAPYEIPIRLSPLYEVNEMLRADKVQNRKDFITYHKATHPRSAQLDLYFKQWLDALDISEETYNNLCEDIDASKT